MTLGKVGRDMRDLEDRVTVLETNGPWQGDERRSDAVFSDKQTEKIKELIEERAEFFRLILWSLGAISSLAVTLIFAWLKLKG